MYCPILCHFLVGFILVRLDQFEIRGTFGSTLDIFCHVYWSKWYNCQMLPLSTHMLSHWLKHVLWPTCCDIFCSCNYNKCEKVFLKKLPSQTNYRTSLFTSLYCTKQRFAWEKNLTDNECVLLQNARLSVTYPALCHLKMTKSPMDLKSVSTNQAEPLFFSITEKKNTFTNVLSPDTPPRDWHAFTSTFIMMRERAVISIDLALFLLNADTHSYIINSSSFA